MATKNLYRIEGYDGSYEGTAALASHTDSRIMGGMRSRTQALATAQVFAVSHPPKSVWGQQQAYLQVVRIGTGHVVCLWAAKDGQWVQGKVSR